ncbi:hypothetical protein [Nocardia tengchongensis]
MSSSTAMATAAAAANGAECNAGYSTPCARTVPSTSPSPTEASTK